MALVHAALVLALWLFAVVVYAVVFAADPAPLWIGVDAALIALALGVVYGRRELLGFSSLGPRRHVWLVAIALVAVAAVLACWAVIEDWNMVALDESNYLMTVRQERIIPDGLLPFNIRWLVPFFAGRWNLLPVADMAAVKAINFGAFVVTAAGLILLLVRLRVPRWLALPAPVFLLASYLGVYGASNRLVLDPANYALYVLLFHALLRREHWPYFSLILLVDAMNAEKAVYWIPVFVAVTFLHTDAPFTRKNVIATLKLSLYCLAPTVIYFIALRLYLAPSRLEANLCFENLHVMGFSNLGGTLTENVKRNGMHTLWFPFGPFTLYTLLALYAHSARHLKPIVLLILPIFVQALIACDTDRMLAYSFIVYVPFGYLYLARAFTELPRRLAVPLFVALLVLAIAQHFGLPLLKQLDIRAPLGANKLKMWLSGIEVVLVGGLVFTHATFFARVRAGSR